MGGLRQRQTVPIVRYHTRSTSMTPSPHAKPETGREIRYVASDNFVPLLERIGCSLLISTYHAGRVVALGVHEGKLVCEFHCFELAMGLAMHPTQLAVGTRHNVLYFHADPRFAASLEPAGCYGDFQLLRLSIFLHRQDMLSVTVKTTLRL